MEESGATYFWGGRGATCFGEGEEQPIFGEGSNLFLGRGKATYFGEGDEQPIFEEERSNLFLLYVYVIKWAKLQKYSYLVLNFFLL